MDPMGHEIDSERFKKLRLNVSYALSNLISSLGRVIDYYQSRNSDTPIERIFLIGLGADFSGLSKLLTNELNVRWFRSSSLTAYMCKEHKPRRGKAGRVFQLCRMFIEPA